MTTCRNAAHGQAVAKMHRLFLSGAILRYIFDDSISPFSRVKRNKRYD